METLTNILTFNKMDISIIISIFIRPVYISDDTFTKFSSVSINDNYILGNDKRRLKALKDYTE